MDSYSTAGQADEVAITIDTRPLDEALSRLSTRLQGQIVREALEAAGEVILESVRALAPERTDNMPGGNSLPPGILKYDLHTETRVTKGTIATVRIGPSDIAGHVCRWQNNGYTLTSHGRKRNRTAINRKDGKPNPIPGKHFLEGGADEAAEAAVDRLVTKIAEALHYNLTGYEGAGKDENYGGENY